MAPLSDGIRVAVCAATDDGPHCTPLRAIREAWETVMQAPLPGDLPYSAAGTIVGHALQSALREVV